MEKEDIKEKYSELKKKYSLPDYDKINDEFEINSIESSEFLLRSVRRKIMEKFEIYIKILEGMLQPDPACVASMHECRFLEEHDKEDIYNIFKRLVMIDREGVGAALGDDNADAEFIKNSFEEWIKVKPSIKAIIDKIRATWDKETDVKEDFEYMG